MKTLLRLIVIAIVGVIALAGCSSDGCLDNGSAIPLVAFYQGTKTVTLKSLTLRGIDAPGDTLLADKASLNQTYLPFRLNATVSQFEFDYNDESVDPDVVTFHYKAIPVFVSHDCGAMYNFEITKCEFTHNAIEDVVIVDSLITNLDRMAIKIYFKEDNNEE